MLKSSFANFTSLLSVQKNLGYPQNSLSSVPDDGGGPSTCDEADARWRRKRQKLLTPTDSTQGNNTTGSNDPETTRTVALQIFSWTPMEQLTTATEVMNAGSTRHDSSSYVQNSMTMHQDGSIPVDTLIEGCAGDSAADAPRVDTRSEANPCAEQLPLITPPVQTAGQQAPLIVGESQGSQENPVNDSWTAQARGTSDGNHSHISANILLVYSRPATPGYDDFPSSFIPFSQDAPTQEQDYFQVFGFL